MPYVLKKDYVIPKGTVFHQSPSLSERITPHQSTIVSFGPDDCGEFVIPEEVAEDNPDLFEWKDD